MKNNKKGFTLAELLIVVAIIAVLVAIAIPVFTTRLEQSRETTDIANLRSAYAVAQVAAMSGDEDGNKISNGNYWYDPNSAVGLTSGTKYKMGKGTATDGKADVKTLPSLITYTTSTDVRDQGIQISFANGSLKGITFADN